MNASAVVLGVMLTLLAYCASRSIAQRYRSPLTTPVLFATIVIVAVLLLTQHTLADYQPARDMMTYLLGPATVALAVQVYRHRAYLLKYAKPALFGIVAGR